MRRGASHSVKQPLLSQGPPAEEATYQDPARSNPACPGLISKLEVSSAENDRRVTRRLYGGRGRPSGHPCCHGSRTRQAGGRGSATGRSGGLGDRKSVV